MNVLPPKPRQTFADYLLMGISPALIIVLVGSLSFFLVQVFYHGEMAGGVRWVLFWYVIAIVLVSRIGIEEGSGRATLFGLALAAATWFYLVRTHPAYLLGMVLLGVTWWCARKLTLDCTLIMDNPDQSGQGVLQDAWKKKASAQPGFPKGTVPFGVPPSGASRAAAGKTGPAPSRAKPPAAASRKCRPQRPGVWVVYFSIAALPLFGLGQVLLPANDAASRRIGFLFLLLYLAAAFGLLLTTSFLGLRRYLRERYLKMPPLMALGWIRFGVVATAAVFIGTLFLPRPGADYTWKSLAYRIDYQLREASQYASSINPHGKGDGQPGKDESPGGNQNGAGETSENDEGKSSGQNGPKADSEKPGQAGSQQSAPSPSPVLSSPARKLHLALRTLLIVAAAVAATWWFIRNRQLLLQIIRSILAALVHFFGRLNETRKAQKAVSESRKVPPRPRYQNPFLTGKDRVWPPERLIIYTHEALQAWAKEQGIAPLPQQTAREFCAGLTEKLPEGELELDRLSYFYGHAAYGCKLPSDYDPESVRRLWHLISV